MLNMRTSVFAEYVNVCINVYKQIKPLVAKIPSGTENKQNITRQIEEHRPYSV